MKGKLDPKTVKELTGVEKRDVASVYPHNLLYKSAADGNKKKCVCLPEIRSSIEDCTLEELKAMVIFSDDSLTGKDRKCLSRSQLLLQIKSFLKMEK